MGREDVSPERENGSNVLESIWQKLPAVGRANQVTGRGSVFLGKRTVQIPASIWKAPFLRDGIFLPGQQMIGSVNRDLTVSGRQRLIACKANRRLPGAAVLIPAAMLE